MPISDVLERAEPDASLVQNRLTVTGFAITALIFSGTFSFNLCGGCDFGWDFLQIAVALVLGLRSMLTLTCFLLSQQLRGGLSWYQSRQWWFSAGQILLFLTLSQALSATLTEVTHQVGLVHRMFGLLLGATALPVWWLLLFVAPITFIRRSLRVATTPRVGLLPVLYGAVLLLVLTFNAWAYALRDAGEGPPGLCIFLTDLILQLIQPLTWYLPFGECGNWTSWC